MEQNQLVKLYEYKDLLRNYLYKYDIDYDDAEDIIQEFLIKMINYKSVFINDKPNFLFLYKCMRNAAFDLKKKKRLKYGVFFSYEEMKNNTKLKERLETALRTNENIYKYNYSILQEYDNKLKYLCKFLESNDGLVLEKFYLEKKLEKQIYDKSYFKMQKIASKFKRQIKQNYEAWNKTRTDI
jgi:hypothetical protein